AEAAGCVPNLLPGYAEAGGAAGLTASEMLARAAEGGLDALLVVGANPALTSGDGATARRALGRVPFLAVVDLLLTETAACADVVFPAAAFAEKRGHVTNIEGRRQAFGQAVEPPVTVATDAQILSALSGTLGFEGLISPDPDALFLELAAAEAAAASLRPKGAALPRPKVDEVPSTVADQVDATHRRLTIVPLPHLYAGGGAAAHDPALAELRPRPFAILHPDDAGRIGVGHGERVVLEGPGGTIDVEARVSDEAPLGVALVVADLPEAPENKLLDGSGFGTATATKAAAAREATA
ncbi:MAG TPA: molybdopterin-dependent oxidoreductase, partial [Candidatus Eremiobacteraceae bacterium]|nr:molybdopterin-dependent oxidoreductase [Candidatus Eremiobacteraceae bacterium]